MVTRAEALTAYGDLAAQHALTEAAMTPRELAEKAHTPGGPPVEELEARIRAERGLPTSPSAGTPRAS